MTLFTQSLPLCLIVILAPERGEAFVSWRNNLRYPLSVSVRADNRWPRSDGRGDSVGLDEEILHVEGPGVSRQEPFTVSREMDRTRGTHYNNWLGHNRSPTREEDEFGPSRTDIPYADRMKELAAARKAQESKEDAPLNPQKPEMETHQDGSPGRPNGISDAQHQPPPQQNGSFSPPPQNDFVAPPIQREPPSATTHSHLNNWLGHNKDASWPSRRKQDEINPVTGEKFYSPQLRRRPNAVPNDFNANGGLNGVRPSISSPSRSNNNNNNAVPSRPSVAAIESYLDGMPGRAPKEFIPPPVTKNVVPPPDVNGAYAQSGLPPNPYLDRDAGVTGNSPPVPDASFAPPNNQGGAAFPTRNGATESNTAANNNPGSYLDSVASAPPVTEYRNGANGNSVPSTPGSSSLGSVSGPSPPFELSNGVNGNTLRSPPGSNTGASSLADSSKASTSPLGSAGMPGSSLNGFAGPSTSTNGRSPPEGGSELPQSYLDAIASSSPPPTGSSHNGRVSADAFKGRDEPRNPAETNAPDRRTFSGPSSRSPSTKGTTAVKKDDALTKNPAERANGAMGSFADNLNGTPSNSGSSNGKAAPLSSVAGTSDTTDSSKVESSKATSTSQGSAGMPGYLNGFGGASSSDNTNDDTTSNGDGGMPQSYLDAIAGSSKLPSAGSATVKGNEATAKNDATTKSQSETGVPGIGSFSNNLSGSSSAKDSTEAKKDGALFEKPIRKTTYEIDSSSDTAKATGVPGVGSFSDMLSGASSSTTAKKDDATSKKPVAESTGVPGVGSFSDNLSRAPPTEDSPASKDEDFVAKKPVKDAKDDDAKVTDIPGAGSFSDHLSRASSSATAKKDDATSKKPVTESTGVSSLSDSSSRAAADDVTQESESGTSGISSSYLDAIGASPPEAEKEVKEPTNAIGITPPATDSAIERKAGGEVETPAEPVARGPAPDRGKFAEMLTNTPPPITDAVVVKKKDDPTKKPVDTLASGGSFFDKLRDRSSSKTSTADAERNAEGAPTRSSEESSGRSRIDLDGISPTNDLSKREEDVVVPNEPKKTVAQARESFADVEATPTKSSDESSGRSRINLDGVSATNDSSKREEDVVVSNEHKRTVAQATESFPDSLKDTPSTSSSVPVNKGDDIGTGKQSTKERQTPLLNKPFSDRRTESVSSKDTSTAKDDRMQVNNALEQASAAMGSFFDNLKGARSTSASASKPETPSTQAPPTVKPPRDIFADAVKEKVRGEQQSFSTASMKPPTSSQEAKPSSVSRSMDEPSAGTSPISKKSSEECQTSRREVPPQRISIPQLMGRLRQGARFGQSGNRDEFVDRERLTLEERIAASIAETRSIEISERTYETTREKLRYARTKTERRLNRSLREQERAAEKIADIRAKMEAKIRAVEEQLGSKLDKDQVGIDEEVGRMADLLVSEYKQEVGRQENLVQLVDVLGGLIAAKDIDISNEKGITDEMVDVRSKLKDGTIAEELDEMIDQKLRTAAIEQELVNALYDCLDDLQGLLGESRDRATRSKDILEGLAQDRPEARSPNSYDWTDFVELEAALKQAANNVRETEERVREVSERIDDALVDRAVVLGEDVPPGLENAARRAAIRIIKKIFSSPDVGLDLDFEGLMELKNKDAKELFAILTKSVGGANEGSRTGIFSLKSLLDGLKGKHQ